MAMFQIYALDEQTKTLPIVDTASGSIATFNTDLTENLVEVKCQIVAKQASGTPSPDNPLPITTYTEMNVSATGGNLYDQTQDTVSSYLDGNGAIQSNSNWHISDYIEIDNAKVIYNGNTSAGRYGAYYDNSKTYISSFAMANGLVSLTPPNNAKYVSFSIFRTDLDNFKVYNGTTSNIPFGQNVANGVIDINSGKLRVTWGILNLSDFTWILASSNTSCNRFSTAGVIPLASQNTHNNICSFDAGGWIQGNSITSSATTVNALDIRTTSILVNLRKTIFDGTAEQFNTWVVDKQICYELATPIEIQLDSITLQALLNENNIWCDTGDTSVKYILSVGKAIS